jgi:hypothetical protein
VRYPSSCRKTGSTESDASIAARFGPHLPGRRNARPGNESRPQRFERISYRRSIAGKPAFAAWPRDALGKWSGAIDGVLRQASSNLAKNSRSHPTVLRFYRSPLRALTTGLRWSNHEGHEDGIRRSAESNERLYDRGSRGPRAGTTIRHRTLFSLVPSCSSCSSCASCASWSTDRPAPLACHGHIPRAVANKSVQRSGRIIWF